MDITLIRRTTAFGAAAALTVSLTALASAPATASGKSARVTHTGSCGASADWTLKVKGDDGLLEVEGEVDSNHAGQTWQWKIRHDGNTVRHGKATTAGRSGSFSITRRIDDAAGADHVTFRAVRPATGEVCVGRVRF
jgi:hypothetical protein